MQKLSAGKFHFEPPSRFTSLDHLVGELLELQRHIDAERLRSLQIDDQFEPRGLLDRQVGRLLALKNAAGIATKLTICIGITSPVAHQAASRGGGRLKGLTVDALLTAAGWAPLSV